MNEEMKIYVTGTVFVVVLFILIGVVSHLDWLLADSYEVQLKRMYKECEKAGEARVEYGPYESQITITCKVRE